MAQPWAVGAHVPGVDGVHVELEGTPWGHGGRWSGTPTGTPSAAVGHSTHGGDGQGPPWGHPAPLNPWGRWSGTSTGTPSATQPMEMTIRDPHGDTQCHSTHGDDTQGPPWGYPTPPNPWGRWPGTSTGTPNATQPTEMTVRDLHGDTQHRSAHGDDGQGPPRGHPTPLNPWGHPTLPNPWR